MVSVSEVFIAVGSELSSGATHSHLLSTPVSMLIMHPFFFSYRLLTGMTYLNPTST